MKNVWMALRLGLLVSLFGILGSLVGAKLAPSFITWPFYLALGIASRSVLYFLLTGKMRVRMKKNLRNCSYDL